jgi:prepilin-type N-terminal cleavage/methylation domain-containing protein
VLRFGLVHTLKSDSGFTLVELLAVAVILIILALMALPVYAEVTDKTREARSQQELRLIEQALEAYKADTDHNHYPPSLSALVDAGFLKPSTDPHRSVFETPWSGLHNRIYYYYAVDRSGDDTATGFVLGDPGGRATCGGVSPESPCGLEPNQAWVTPGLATPDGIDSNHIRKSR